RARRSSPPPPVAAPRPEPARQPVVAEPSQPAPAAAPQQAGGFQMETTMAADAHPVGRSHTIAYLPGDGIGPEVAAQARKAVGAAADRFEFGVDWVDHDLGADRWLRTGEFLPDGVLEELKASDAILLGAVGRPDVPAGLLERSLLLRLRFELDLYVNLRPAKLYPGVASPLAGAGPGDVDLEVVRENTEGAYVGAGGLVHEGTPLEVAVEESVTTRAGVERCVRYAAGRAAGRGGRLTLVHKRNVLRHSGDLWSAVAAAVGGGVGARPARLPD